MVANEDVHTSHASSVYHYHTAVDHTESSTNKTDSHDINEILLKIALNTITLTLD
jgi:hypothetical protein